MGHMITVGEPKLDRLARLHSNLVDRSHHLTGNVDLRFKSDYFPLEKMLDMLGTNQTVLTQVAQQPTPQQTQQVQPIAPPPAPALPAPPPFAAGGAVAR